MVRHGHRHRGIDGHLQLVGVGCREHDPVRGPGVQRFAGASTVWTLDKSGTSNGASSTTVPYPSLTPSGSGELYFGYAEVANNASAGSTPGSPMR